jgi:hypothetical protein
MRVAASIREEHSHRFYGRAAKFELIVDRSKKDAEAQVVDG